jgi:hypothetical protein
MTTHPLIFWHASYDRPAAGLKKLKKCDYVPRALGRIKRWMIMKGDERKNAKTRSEKDDVGSAGGVKRPKSEKSENDNGNGPAESRRWLFAGRQK